MLHLFNFEISDGINVIQKSLLLNTKISIYLLNI